jgi:hypothetical protein
MVVVVRFRICASTDCIITIIHGFATCLLCSAAIKTRIKSARTIPILERVAACIYASISSVAALVKGHSDTIEQSSREFVTPATEYCGVVWILDVFAVQLSVVRSPARNEIVFMPKI